MYPVSVHDKKPLLNFMLDSLRTCGCTIVHEPSVDQAPYRIVFDSPHGERHGIVAYPFFANSRPTKNRPKDEHRFQLKYGPKDGKLHTLWQDPYGLYTTLLLGIDPERQIFVGADPVLHNPTRFFISIEFKREHADQIKRDGWATWERERQGRDAGDSPIEVLVGGTPGSFLTYVRFEREALAEDQGHRQLLAERLPRKLSSEAPEASQPVALLTTDRIHELATEFKLSSDEILDLISRARRLKMAVRGWVAEEHLVRTLRSVRGVTDCQRDDEEGHPDVTLRYDGSKPISIECKNVLRKPSRNGNPRIDFQRTRASKADPCSRYYRTRDFDLVAACLHAVTEKWEFAYAPTANLEPHARCAGRLASNVEVDREWNRHPHQALIELIRASAT